MLEDHSPTSRSSSRKPFRRKGGKNVIFDSSCVYYQLDPTDDTSEAEDDDGDQDDMITDSQLDVLDESVKETSIRVEGNQTKPVQRQKSQAAVEEIDKNVEQPHPSPRMDSETIDVTGAVYIGGHFSFQIMRDVKLCVSRISTIKSVVDLPRQYFAIQSWNLSRYPSLHPLLAIASLWVP